MQVGGKEILCRGRRDGLIRQKKALDERRTVFGVRGRCVRYGFEWRECEGFEWVK